MSTMPLPFVCAWCDRVRTSEGRWEEVDVSLPVPEAATHGICPQCLADETRAACVRVELR